MAFGPRLRALRKEKRLSRSQLAAKLEVDPKTIQRWELGENDPTADVQRLTDQLDRLKRLAAHLGVSLDALTTDIAEDPAPAKAVGA